MRTTMSTNRKRSMQAETTTQKRSNTAVGLLSSTCIDRDRPNEPWRLYTFYSSVHKN
ncbi:unnamed protein product [Nippostrongylus brasiliensis]|uniref:Uncharacterized protein n=1 Tax=Nippostrongylus brasiliensis TaxID=27835 RepID=A0A0N4XJB2_NIPBR|nr:unnamed protein product [Nippostrongylus brasiliensis]